MAAPGRTAAAGWRSDVQLWVELFAAFNFAALAGDVFLAHSANSFRRGSEWIPVYVSAAAALVMAVAIVARQRFGRGDVWRDLGYLAGWLSIAVGVAGVVLHLDSRFFEERTIRSLTYAAPFAAPLAFTGLGLLVVANRMVDPQTREWAHWIVLLALGGFAGNFVFSLTDHAMNGFFNPLEWVPVVTSAFAVSFLLVIFLVPVTPAYLKACAIVLAIQAAVGVAGFGLHARADLRQPGSIAERVLSGAPPLAPLLLPNLVLLGWIGLWALHHAPAVHRGSTQGS